MSHDITSPPIEKRISRKDLIDETLPLGVDPRTVLKKGYLIKMGHLVKNWKRRLFVLDPENLSYFKAEKLRGYVPVSKITRIVAKMDSKGVWCGVRTLCCLHAISNNFHV